MIDPNLIRKDPEKIKKIVAAGRSKPEKANIDIWLTLDEKRSALIANRDEKREARNQISQNLKGKPDAETIAKAKTLKDEIELLENELKVIEQQWQEILDWMPNIYLDDVPIGKTSDENVEVKAWIPGAGYLKKDQLGLGEHSGQFMPVTAAHADTEFEPKPHWETGLNLDIIDIEAGAKISGSRFYYIKKEGALLIYATFNLLLRKLIDEGFDPLIVPVMVKREALYGSSHFPGDEDQVYKLESKYLEDANALYLVGSSEPSNFGYFMDKIFTEEELPIKVMAQTTCFRSEVGSWGKDVRGIKRTHQFDKLEMNMIIPADEQKAREAQEYLLSLNEWLLQQLEIPYHVINMCVGDLGYFAAAKKYDIEFWTPSQKSYTELMSNSITTDYQARRLNIKYKDSEGKSKYAYTLNDTGVTHRVLIAILEHYQQADGSVKVPNVLVPFVGKQYIGK